MLDSQTVTLARTDCIQLPVTSLCFGFLCVVNLLHFSYFVAGLREAEQKALEFGRVTVKSHSDNDISELGRWERWDREPGVVHGFYV